MVRLPIYDPTGLATDQYLVRKSLPEGVKGVSSGHVTHSKPFERVPWPGIEVTPTLAAMRALNLALALVPARLAILALRPLRPRARSPPERSGGQVSNRRIAPKTEKTRPDPGSFRFGGGAEAGT